MENKNSWKGWLYLLPALVILAVFTFYPLINTFYLSFLLIFFTTLYTIKVPT